MKPAPSAVIKVMVSRRVEAAEPLGDGQRRWWEWYTDNIKAGKIINKHNCFSRLFFRCNLSIEAEGKEVAMKYFYELQDWLYQTEFYQEVLKELPEPLNNIYFDTIVAVIIVVYLLYRIVDMLHSFFYYRRIRKMAEQEQKEKKEQEARMLKREEQVYEKEERLGRFMDFLFISRMNRVQEEEIYDSTCTPQPQSDNVKKLTKRRPLLDRRKKSAPLLLGRKEEKVSDYDVVMDAYAYDEKQEQDLEQQQKQSKEKMYSQLHSLDESLKVKPIEEGVEISYGQSDAWLEKQKAKARKQQERERKREERLQARQQKKGGGHGGYGK